MGCHHPQSFPREQVMPLRHLRDIANGLQTEAFKSPAGKLALSTLLVEQPNLLCVSLVAGSTSLVKGSAPRKASAAAAGAAAAASSAVDPAAASVDLVWNLVAPSQTARDEFVEALKSIFVVSNDGGPRAIVDKGLQLSACSAAVAVSSAAAAEVSPSFQFASSASSSSSSNSSSALATLERGISCRLVCTDGDDDDAGAVEGEKASAASGEASNHVRVRRVFLWLDLSAGGDGGSSNLPGTFFWSPSQDQRPVAIADADSARNSLRVNRIKDIFTATKSNGAFRVAKKRSASGDAWTSWPAQCCVSLLDAQGRGLNLIADSVADMREIVQAVRDSIIGAAQRNNIHQPRGNATEQQRRQQREREEAKRQLDAERPDDDPLQPQRPRSCCVVS
jgi:hypothetical protein